ncbi:MAG: metallophosphoesterase [Candidatus Gracilibacteria bacterium]|nr:metallophosphoesterase [Candidatus Gracilibacteria bacterium]
MSKYKYFVFYSVFLAFLFLVNWQVYSYGLPTLSQYPLLQNIYSTVFWILAPMFVVARVLERYYKKKIVSFLLWVGAFWLAMLNYLTLQLLLIYGVLFVTRNTSVDLFVFHETYHLVIGTAIGIISFLLSAYGWHNAHHPIIRKLEYIFPKGSGKGGDFHIVAASDVHLGTMIGKKRFGKFVRDVNLLKPDAIFFVGDTIDEDIEPVIRQDIGSSIKKLHAPLGVFCINGNHEHMGGVERADAYLMEHGVTMLRDQFVVLDEAFVLVGREDISAPMFSGAKRATLHTLLSSIPKNLPIILLDHQPAAIMETANDGRVALQLSGHTHHGQLWPFSIMTRLAFKISWGGKKINNTEFYVSSGWGTWGPPVRTGNVPELLDIRIRFE